MYRKAAAFLLAAVALAAAPLAAQTPLRVGQTVTGTLDASDPRTEDGSPYDTYTIQGRPGDRVIVRMRSDEFDTVLHWGRDVGGTFTATAGDDDGGGGTDSRLVLTLGADGANILRASAFEESEGGAYELQVYAARDVVPGRIRVGESVRGELAPDDFEGDEGGEDHYDLAGRRGEVVTVFAESDELDTYVRVGTWSNGAFQEIEADDDSGVGTNAQVVVEFDESRDYRVIVRSFSGQAHGPYTLRVQAGAAEPVEEEFDEMDLDEMDEEWMDFEDAPWVGTLAGPVQLGRATSGTLGDGDGEGDGPPARFYRDYTLRAAAGERLVVQVTAEELDAFVRVGRGTGDAFESLAEDDDGGEGLDSRLEWEAPQAGTYTVRVTSAFPGQAGEYVLRVDRAP